MRKVFLIGLLSVLAACSMSKGVMAPWRRCVHRSSDAMRRLRITVIRRDC